MELNVWTSTTIDKLEEDPSGKSWTVTVSRATDGTKRTFKPRHVVFAHGLGGGEKKMPSIPGMVGCPPAGSVVKEVR
jgi:cation diffusion facilitator CzcD-associated flavoprotein CzcO